MNNSSDTLSPYEPPGWVLRGFVIALAVIGLLLSGFLLYESMVNTALPGCGPGSGCDTVLGSAWSKVLGVPVAAPAVVLYAVMCVATLFIGPVAPVRQRWAWKVLLAAAVCVIGAAVYFVAVQLAMIGALCKYCTAAHAVGVVLAFTLLLIAPVGREPPRGGKIEAVDVPIRTASALAAVGLFAVAFLISMQMAFPTQTMRIDTGPILPSAGGGALHISGSIKSGPADIDTGPGPDRRISVLQRKFEFEPHQVPVFGSPDAPVILAELFDYTCPHCRRMHGMLKVARQRYGAQFAVLKLPTPLDSDCNPLVTKNNKRHENACELADLAVAVWLASPEKFSAYEDYLFYNESPPDLHAARRVAKGRVGAAALEQALADPRLRQLISRNVAMYQETGNRAVPQFVYQAVRITGNASTPQQLFDVLEKATPLEAPQGAEDSGTKGRP